MKRVAAIVLGLLLLWTPARAEDLFADELFSGKTDMQNALDGEARSLLGRIEGDGSLMQLVTDALEHTQREQQSAVRRTVVTLGRMAVVLLFCGCAGSFSDGGKVGTFVICLAGALGVTAAAYGDLSGLMGVCTETAEEIRVFSKSMLPVMLTAMTLTGAPTTATLMHSGTMFALDLCITLITGVFVPAVSAYVAMITVNAAMGNDMLTRLAAFVKWVTVGSLKLLLTVFFSYVTISGSVSHGLDANAVKATKFALSGSVPVVGSILSGATDTVLSGAVLLKNSLGLFGMLCIMAICLVPFLRVGISYLLLRVGCALLSPICPKQLNGLLDGIIASIGLILGMLGSCSAIVFFELVYAVVMAT